MIPGLRITEHQEVKDTWPFSRLAILTSFWPGAFRGIPSSLRVFPTERCMPPHPISHAHAQLRMVWRGHPSLAPFLLDDPWLLKVLLFQMSEEGAQRGPMTCPGLGWGSQALFHPCQHSSLPESATFEPWDFIKTPVPAGPLFPHLYLGISRPLGLASVLAPSKGNGRVLQPTVDTEGT